MFQEYKGWSCSATTACHPRFSVTVCICQCRPKNMTFLECGRSGIGRWTKHKLPLKQFIWVSNSFYHSLSTTSSFSILLSAAFVRSVEVNHFDLMCLSEAAHNHAGQFQCSMMFPMPYAVLGCWTSGCPLTGFEHIWTVAGPDVTAVT